MDAAIMVMMKGFELVVIIIDWDTYCDNILFKQSRVETVVAGAFVSSFFPPLYSEPMTSLRYN